MSSSRLDEAIELRLSGLSQREVARRLGVSRSVLCRLLDPSLSKGDTAGQALRYRESHREQERARVAAYRARQKAARERGERLPGPQQPAGGTEGQQTARVSGEGQR